MNDTARSLGLRNTHYADDTGVSNDSVSTALDQAKLATMLMRSPLVRTIVDQTEVDLPVVGFVNTFTPLVGINDVVGVKSGRTTAAGGCDVMAVAYRLNGRRHLIYAVVLGQRVGNVLVDAGDAAYALATSAEASQAERRVRQRRCLGNDWIRRRRRALRTRALEPGVLVGSTQLPSLQLRLRHSVTIHRGEVVGWIEVHGVEKPVPLVAASIRRAPTLWHRIL